MRDAQRKETSEDTIYVNTLERYSNSKISPMMDFVCVSPPARRMLRSDSEPDFNKIPLVNVGNNRSRSAIPPYLSSMDRALEECIQLDVGKTKESVKKRKCCACCQEHTRIPTQALQNAAYGDRRRRLKTTRRSQNDRGSISEEIVDDENIPTELSPLNPNGSIERLAGVCSENGRHLAMMPYIERCVQPFQWPYIPPG
ncbi:hypothetical protein WA026_019312 [Henosepilachna vigintioctopunctata]|uniref:Uncharacterized protein n=1 Tax=Henosepilachna vigintioctopunctata TaxID=420089 RepID=A0AAW1UAA5_9CUCU